MGLVARGIIAYGIPFKENAESTAFEWSEQFESDDGWRRAELFAARYGVDIMYLGRHDYGLPFVHVVASLVEASWAETVRITGLQIGDGWNNQLRIYAGATDLDLSLCESPHWVLSSIYG